MEDQAPPQDSAASRSAEALRALCDRAQSTATARREGIGRLEARLAEQLDALTEAVAGQLSEISAETEQERASHEAEAADAAALQEELSHAQAEFEQRQAEWEAHVQERGEELSQLAEDLDRREAKWEAHVRDKGQELSRQADELKQQQEQLLQKQQEMEANAAEWKAQEERLAATAAENSAREEALNQRQGELEQREQKLTEHQADLDRQRGELKRKQAEFEAQSGDAANREQAESEQAKALQALSAELEEREERFRQANADLERRLADLQAHSQAAEEKRDQLDAWQQELDARQSELDARVDSPAGSGDHDELQLNLDIAMEDVEKLRAQVAELEGQLAGNEDAVGVDSAELEALRAERDALAERVTALEGGLELPDGDGSEQMSDLRRRFEMAVDDVRQLKSENARLEERLAAAKSAGGGVVAASGAMDWEAQKRRMLADLEGDGADLDPQEQAQRTSIEDTIRITDEVVALKDLEIAELKEQLAQAPSPEPQVDAEAAQREQLFNGDEIIQQHRQQLAELERQMRDKLRQTELDLSVERAKITREQSELAEWRLELESLRESLTGGSSGQPKRRWLTKLGLGQDE